MAARSANPWPVTIAVMLATVMNTLDMTIANVALPQVQASLNAGYDEITWVLTSYIVAAAIMTPLSGWLGDRVGRKRVFLISIAGFTVSSMLCGIAADLPQMVAFRLLQGASGAALMPLSQAVLLDTWPPQKHGQAMSIWGMGSIMGPILGPAVGGYLTEYFSWRWCFYINLPVGAVALAGAWLFISGERSERSKPFDFMGFGMLTLGVGSLQLMLDRGAGQDWFNSTEIWIEAAIALSAFWAFLIHTLTAEHPFFDRRLMRDRNFVMATGYGFLVGMLLFSTMALWPPLMQVLMGYPVLTAGLLNVPRGMGSFIAMLIVGRLLGGRLDSRFILLAGMLMLCLSTWQMSHFNLTIGPAPFAIAGLLQGFAMAGIFVTLSTLAFATLPPSLRSEGASVYTLVRSLGSSLGIAIMQAMVVANTQVMHASLAGRIDPSSPSVRALPPVMDPSAPAGAALLNGEITRQATMVAYLNDFRVMFVGSLLFIPLLLFMRRSKTPPPEEAARVGIE